MTGDFIIEIFPFQNNPAKDGIFDFPIFSPSRRVYEPEAIIPFFSRRRGMSQKKLASKKTLFSIAYRNSETLAFYVRHSGVKNFLELVQNGLQKRDGKVRKRSAIKENLDLLNEFMKYAFNNPEILEKIPPEAEIVILPINDQELYEYNKKMADKMFSQGKKVVFVKIRKPEKLVPELEFMMTGAG